MAKIITLSGVVGWEITARFLKSQLVKDDINILKVDSEGGSVFEANRLFNVITDHLKDHPDSIKVELGALAASAASYFPLAVGKENVSVRSNTTFMIHKAWFFTWGNSDELSRDAEILDGLDRIIAKIYMAYTGGTIEDTLESMKNELWVIGGDAIVEAGFASEVVDSSSSGETVSDEIIEKSEILAKIEEAKNKLKDHEIKEDLNKWAAKIKKDLNPSGEIKTPVSDENKNGSSPVTGININSEENMKLGEYLEKNPDAKSEFEQKVNLAVEDREKVIVDEERERVSEIIALTSVKLPENVMKAIESGDSTGDFAQAEIKAEKEKKAEGSPDDLGKITDNGQLPAAVVSDKKTKDEEAREAVSKYRAGKGGRK